MGVLSRLKPRIEGSLKGFVGVLAGLHGNPNTYTVLGAALSVSAPIAAAAGFSLFVPLLAGLGAAMDAIDGMIARVAGRSSRRGALLDSVLDRVSDSSYAAALLLLGVDPVAVVAAVTGSLVVPYVRAKAEALGVELAGRGVLERPERTLLYLVALVLAALDFTGLALAVTVAIAVLAWATAAHRLIIAWREAG